MTTKCSISKSLENPPLIVVKTTFVDLGWAKVSVDEFFFGGGGVEPVLRGGGGGGTIPFFPKI